ncbi:hypothetical protein SDC9_190442 [bioreactor metagenome]|uniref:Uncharacterized protein n=1 Tax=bioreactor metagenome TaxID=1076179 RepID=A0A645I3A2_9ZZZZ
MDHPFEHLRQHRAEKGVVMHQHSVPDDDADDRQVLQVVALSRPDLRRIREGTDSRFADHVAVVGQHFHRLADRGAAAAEQFGQFPGGRELDHPVVGAVNPVQDVAPDFHVFRGGCLLFHAVLLYFVFPFLHNVDRQRFVCNHRRLFFGDFKENGGTAGERRRIDVEEQSPGFRFHRKFRLPFSVQVYGERLQLRGVFMVQGH